jgi:hypothetical protein
MLGEFVPATTQDAVIPSGALPVCIAENYSIYLHLSMEALVT